MARTKITRHFATINDGRWGTRQVHYRRAGSGPAAILFHQSPLSSRDMLPTMQAWAGRFTCIAPDSPGYGLSDPLGVAQADMQDFADAQLEFLDAIGVRKAAVYGFHTGAMIAAAVAARAPERITCSVSNGYVVLTEPERADIVAHYLPPFVPAWDGSHLTWLWARMREQTIFFPWYRKSQADRLDFDVPAPEVLMAGALDFLRAGDHYRVGYRAAFTMASGEVLRHLRVPTLITAYDTDVLASHLARIREPSPTVTVKAGGTPAETLELCAAFIRRHRAPAPPPAPATAPIRGRMWQAMIDVKGGQLRARRNTDAPGRTVVVQHDAASSSDIVEPLARSFIGLRPVVAIDLPGHGESDNTLPKGRVTVEGYANALRGALRALDVDRCDLVGTWGGGLVALELALRDPKRVGKLVLADLLYYPRALKKHLAKHYTPDIRPDWYGGHLLQAWNMMRDQGLFWPWFERTKAGIIRQPLFIDPAMIHKRVIEVFRAPEMWRAAYQSHFAYPVHERLAALRAPALLAAPSWDPNLAHTQEAARKFPHFPFRLMPDEWTKWGRELVPFFDA
jgi:pimeloyl-ACP methyl ester carboxylesterase